MCEKITCPICTESWVEPCDKDGCFDWTLNQTKRKCSRCRSAEYGRTGEVSKDSEGCFITTATLSHLNGNDDNCYELSKAREFRDHWVKENYPEKVKEYYDIAPKIVEDINNHIKSDQIYLSIWNRYLSRCLSLIEKGHKQQAYEVYASMVNDLKSEYLKN